MGTHLTPTKAGIKTYYSSAQHKALGTVLSLALMFFMSNLQDISNKFRKVKDTGLYKWLTSSTTAQLAWSPIHRIVELMQIKFI